ncbi:MAG: fibronectin type III domain-containing protein [Oligoflexus sp.]
MMMVSRITSIILFVWMCSTTYATAKVYHERVIWHENPANEAIISWTTDEQGQQSYVLYDSIARKGEVKTYRFQQSAQLEGRFDRGWLFGKTPYYHHTKLTDLTPDTDYYFVVVTDNEQSQEYWFRTAPADDSEFSLIFGGDSRSDHTQRIRMNQLLREKFERADEVYALVHGGDYIADGGKWSDWDQWLHHHNYTITASRRMLPIVPTRGNHEYNPQLFNQVFAFPGGGKSYYTTRIQKLAIITLNTEISTHGEQRIWLTNELERRQKDSKWIVANYHRPAYPAVKRPSSAKSAWVPLFEQYQIDLVFESDGHVYKQTLPIFNERHDAERGIVYVGEGGLGVRQRTPDHKLWYLQGEGFAVSSHHFQILRITEDNLFFEGIAEDNSLLTSLSLEPREERAHL